MAKQNHTDHKLLNGIMHQQYILCRHFFLMMNVKSLVFHVLIQNISIYL